MTTKNNSKPSTYWCSTEGYTIVEVILVMGVLAIFSSFLLFNANPSEKRMIARDNRRLNDINTLDRMINEYLLDNKAYPDTSNILRDSTTLPQGSTGLPKSDFGWISANLAKYNSNLPLDPINSEPYKYYYYHDSNSYELNCTMENLTEYAVNDGGNDATRYEIGNNLQLISP